MKLDQISEDQRVIVNALMQYNKSAVLELSEGRYEQALEFFRLSLDLEKELGLERYYAQTLMNLANTCLLLKDADRGLAYVLEAVQTFARINCRSDYLRARLLEGFLYLNRKEDGRAQPVLEEVLRKADSDELKGEAYLLLYRLYMQRQKLSQAQDSISRAISFLERSGAREKLLQALNARAAFFSRQNKERLAAMDQNRIQMLLEEEKPD